MILNACAGKPLPVYGDGENVRDWLYVEDHCRAIRTVLAHGRVGETYNIGGRSEKKNLEIVGTICQLLDELRPNDPAVPHSELDHFRQRSPRPRPPLRHGHAQNRARTELAARWRRLRAASAKPFAGILNTKTGSATLPAAAIVNGWRNTTPPSIETESRVKAN